MAALSIDSLTMGEIAVVEDLSNIAIDELGTPGTPKGKIFAAMAYVAKLRENPEFTFNEALGLTFDQIQDIVAIDEDGATTDPKEADPDTAKSPKTD